MAKAPCGPPKPRKAVLDWVFVRARCPCRDTSGIQYALSAWQRARVSTGGDRSVEKPALAIIESSTPSRRPVSSNPASQSNSKPWRRPVIMKSSSRS